MTEKADGHPTKEFFVSMITKDIQLDACILDLLDNCLDGANGTIASKGIHQKPRYNGFWAEITISEHEFKIKDNCGGVLINEAKNFAFRFGRRPYAPAGANDSIGLYGIGMKRAVFKIGKDIDIESSTDAEGFNVSINVGAWLATQAWDFDLELEPPAETAGTSINIKDLHDEVKGEFKDPIFINKLRSSIARDYSLFLQDGFTVKVNGTKVAPYEFNLRSSEQFAPVRKEYDDDSIHVEVTAVMAGLPLDDTSPDSVESILDEVDYYGWFVLCNDRVVIAADKTSATVWGDEEFPNWHPQYNGFMGFVAFRSAKAELLPWTTTKRQIDLDDPAYRRAVIVMKEVTRQYIDYTNQRKVNLDEAKELEKQTTPVPVVTIQRREVMVLPQLSPRLDLATINYRKPRREVRKVAEALGNVAMTYRQVGIETFDYYYNTHVED